MIKYGRCEDKDYSAVVSFRILYDYDIYGGELSIPYRGNDCGHNTRTDDGISNYTLIPPLMAFLSLTLKDSINHWLNIIVGTVFIVLMPTGAIGFPTAYLPSLIIIAIVEIVALALIVWYAWKWKV